VVAYKMGAVKQAFFSKNHIFKTSGPQGKTEDTNISEIVFTVF